MNPLDMNTKAQRNLSKEDLKDLYSDSELRRLISTNPPGETHYLADEKFTESFKKYKDETKALNKVHKWTPKEDAFLRACYMYLSDATMALALNVPTEHIQHRRNVLKLKKGYVIPLEVIVWCKRESFEDDIKKQNLTKARPELRDILQQPKVYD